MTIDLAERCDTARGYIDSLPPSMARESERILYAWRNGASLDVGLNPGGGYRYPSSSVRLLAILRDDAGRQGQH